MATKPPSGSTPVLGKFNNFDVSTTPNVNPPPKQTRRKTGSEVVDVRRKYKHYSISQTEMFGLGLSETVGGGLLGWGVNMSTVYAGMAQDDIQRPLIGWTTLFLISAGAAFMLVPVALLVFVKKTSEE